MKEYNYRSVALASIGGTRDIYVRVLVQRSSRFREYRPARERKKEDRQCLGPGVS